MGSLDHRLLSLWVSRICHWRVTSKKPEHSADKNLALPALPFAEYSVELAPMTIRAVCHLNGNHNTIKLMYESQGVWRALKYA